MSVRTKYGKIEGVKCAGYTVYKGIPYAKPPVGTLRWREPQEPDCWEGVYQADTFQKKCPQDESGFELYTKEFYSDPEFLREASEDCLYLNIWVPEGAADLPVAFWIHGGGFGGGYSSEIEFDGEEYCKRGVILVTIQYRVNIFGFFSHPWLDAESSLDVSGNQGILDQIAALNWVYENIAAFGGDPKNITAFGQSAGCSSVQCLVSTRLTGDKIAKAILQSGSGYDRVVIEAATKEEAAEVGETFVKLTGAENLEELRALSTEKIVHYRKELEKIMFPIRKELFMKPCVDGVIIEDMYDNLTRDGKIKDIPYMIGSTERDLFVTEEELAGGNRGKLYETCKNWSYHLEELGRKPAYVYYFKHHLPGDEAGAFHSAELWYTFGTLGRCWRPMQKEDYEISRQMVSCWTGFMKSGNPDSAEVPGWEPCTRENPFVREF